MEECKILMDGPQTMLLKCAVLITYNLDITWTVITIFLKTFLLCSALSLMSGTKSVPREPSDCLSHSSRSRLKLKKLTFIINLIICISLSISQFNVNPSETR